MIKKILIAVDGSQHSLQSVEIGSEIAKAMGAKVVLFHVVKPYRLPDSLKKLAKAEHMAAIDADLLNQGAKYLLAGALDIAHGAGLKRRGYRDQRRPNRPHNCRSGQVFQG